MYRKRWVCLGLSLFFFALFLVVGVVGPILLDKEIQKSVNEKMVMKESNADQWGLCPGHTRVHINREFFFFNLSNPQETLWDGALPSVAQTLEPYRYLEVDHYMERIYEYDEETDEDYVRFRRYTWFNKTDDWAPNYHPTDLITNINVGSISAWDQMKHLPPETVALAAMYSVISGLDGIMLVSAMAQGIVATFEGLGNFEEHFSELVCQPAQVTDANLTKALWADELYGWGNQNTFAIWIQAEMQCFQDSDSPRCIYSPSAGGAIYLLKEYFGLSDVQMSGLLSGWLQDSFTTMALILPNAFGCPTTYCEPHYLTALQWSQQGVTNSPPSPTIPAVASVALINTTIGGYPEISYFRDNYYPASSPLSQVSFTVDEALQLLDYNLETGWPSGSAHTLLDVGHMNNLFALGRAGDFEGLAAAFNLTSASHGEVLFDYINTLVAVTALQGRTSQAVYNEGNRGLTNELSLGNLLSQTMSQLYYGVSQVLAMELTSRYAFAFLSHDPISATTCANLLKACGVPQDLCAGQTLGWNNPSSLDLWFMAYWNGQNSPQWDEFAMLAGFTPQEMEALFGPQSALTILFEVIDSNLHQHYGCHNPGSRCSHYELYTQQWALSNITLNLPSIMALIGMSNSSSMLEWGEPFTSLMPAPPEYYFYLETNNLLKASITYEVATALLNPMGILNQVECQRYFTLIFDYETLGLNTYPEITNDFLIDDVATFTTYLRKLVDTFAIGGLFITQTVDEWLWTGTNALLVQVANTNPLQGGNPAVNPTQVQLGQNTTRASLRFPDHFKHAMITGKKHVESKLRWWYLFYGNPNVTLFTQVYTGHLPNGQPNIEYQTQQVWEVPQEIMGGDALNFQTNIDSGSAVWLYLDPFLRFGEGSYDHSLTISDMNVYRFMVSNNLVANAQDNPANSIYYCYGPSGVANITPVTQGPMFIGKPYFYGGQTDQLLNVLNITSPFSRDKLDVYDSYFDLEHYTGAVFSEEEKIMTVVELRGDILYPKLGLNGFNSEGIWTYLPIFFMNRSSHYPIHRINFLFGQIKTGMDMIKWVQITGLVLASLFFAVAAGLGLWLFFAKRAARKNPGVPDGQETQDYMLSTE